MDEIVDRLTRVDACAVSDALDRLRPAGAVTGISPAISDRPESRDAS